MEFQEISEGFISILGGSMKLSMVFYELSWSSEGFLRSSRGVSKFFRRLYGLQLFSRKLKALQEVSGKGISGVLRGL